MSKLLEMPANINVTDAYKDRKFTKWTAIAMLFGEIEINNYEFQAFYTRSAARKWLKE